MTLRLTEQDTADLRARAECEGRSMQDVALSAVRSYLRDQSQEQLLEAALEDTLARYGDALRRLGE